MKTFLGLTPLLLALFYASKQLITQGPPIMQYVLIELPLRISDEIARRLGILAMSKETRGKQLDYLSERWFIQDGRVNFVKLIPLSKNLNYYQEDLIDSEAHKSRKINSQTLSKGLWKTLFQAVVLT